jgi:hypothetical protein
MGDLKERAIDGCLLFGVLMCLTTLVYLFPRALQHVATGAVFALVAVFTASRGIHSESRVAAYRWYVCTGAVGLLFSYWALTSVFPSPRVKKDIGCGGVRFVNAPPMHEEL